jgi:cytochrome c-type biogenesis protein CcmE
MTRKRARLYGVLLLLLGVGVAAALVLTALKDNVSYFRTPTEIVSGTYPEHASGRALRLGGMVEKGSVVHNGTIVTFRLTDFTNTMSVHYEGLLPDLFREGQGVIAEGKMAADGVFMADTILAKHDEKYMPPELKNMKPPEAKAP